MSNALRDSLQTFLQGIPPTNSQTLLVDAIQKWSETTEWQSQIASLSPASQIAALVALGSEAYESDWGNLRSNLLYNTRSVGQYVEPFTPSNWLEQNAQFLFVSLLDPLVLNDDSRRLATFERSELIGAERLPAALERGRGVLLVSCHQTHAGFCLRHPQFSDRTFTAVSHDISDANRGDYLAYAAYGDCVEFAPTTAAGARRMLARLKSNGAVALYNDFRFPESPGIPSLLFGRPVFSSKSLVNFILKTRACVLPFTVVRVPPFEDEHLKVELLPELPFDDLGEGERDSVTAAMRLGLATECLIRRYPIQWRLWTSLEYRWNEGQSAWSDLGRVFEAGASPQAGSLAESSA
jgi:lauroyl/myristoyl acyltransferase